MASGPGQPARGPGRLADSLARHRWVTAAGMTATVAAVAGGGLALAVHDGSSGPARECGLVPCAAALPAAVRSSGTGSASAPATAIRRASAPSSRPAPAATAPEGATPSAGAPASAEPVSVPEPLSSTAPVASSPPVASSAGRAASANHAIGVGYAITEDSHHRIHGEFVIVNTSSAPVSGWRVTAVLPGDTGYQVLDARNRSAGDALVMTAPSGVQALAGGGTELIAFTARGAASTPVRCTFSESAHPKATRDGSAGGGGSGTAGHDRAAGGQPGSAQHDHDGWLGRWLRGWPTRGWPGNGWPTQGGEGGWAGHHHGWPGGH